MLLYYMYREKAEPAPTEPDVIKVRDYEAQRAAEKPAEALEEQAEEPEAPSEEPQPEPAEPEPEPAEPSPEEPKPEAVADDLESLTGVGEKYRALLRAAGVRSIAMLADEEPDALLERLTETNVTEEIVKRLPRPEDVDDWVQKAKQQSA